MFAKGNAIAFHLTGCILAVFNSCDSCSDMVYCLLDGGVPSVAERSLFVGRTIAAVCCCDGRASNQNADMATPSDDA